MFTHFVLHNPQAANGQGMEVYSMDETKKMLDRVLDIFDGGGLVAASKHRASLLIDGKIDEVFGKSKGALRDITLFSGSREKNVHIYIATLGKAAK